MREVIDELLRWWNDGETIGMGTVVATFHSAPRPAGAAMLRCPDGAAVGSVSGGCVEGAVYELAGEVVERGVPELSRYGVSDEDAFAVGLTCGGVIDVFVEPVSRARFPELPEVARSLRAGEPVAVVTAVEGPPELLGRRLVIWPDRWSGTLGTPPLDAVVVADAQGMLRQARTGMMRYGRDGTRFGDEVGVFVACHAPPPRMLVFGAVDFAGALARLGGFLGYRVTICDARPVFATRRRFPEAEVVVDWPHRYLKSTSVDERTVVCVLTHDPKFDLPLLEVALRLPVAYVGAMGSRRTHRDRCEALRESGMTDAELARLAAPIGLDLGGDTAEETAVSIAAEIIASRTGRPGGRLNEAAGPIHAPHRDAGHVRA